MATAAEAPYFNQYFVFLCRWTWILLVAQMLVSECLEARRSFSLGGVRGIYQHLVLNVWRWIDLAMIAISITFFTQERRAQRISDKSELLQAGRHGQK